MRQQRNGFTLIELVVVILILGILAGVGAPKLFSTSGMATENGVRQTLSIIRDGIELYAADNAGVFPACTTDGSDFHLTMKDYLRGKFPVSPVGTETNTVKPSNAPSLAAEATPTSGWLYNPATGEFICNSNDPIPSDTTGTIRYDEL